MSNLRSLQNIPLTPSFADFEEQSSKGNLIPVYAELSADYETPISIFQKICNGKYSFLLESAESTDRAGRYSFIGSFDGSLHFGISYLVAISIITWLIAFYLYKVGYKIKS